MTSQTFNDSFAKLANEEGQFIGQQFLSPRLNGQKIRVRIGGVVMSLNVAGKQKDFQGWGVFRVLGYRSAKFSREATIKERSDYLNLFPKVRLLLHHKEGDVWHGSLAHPGNGKFRFNGTVSVGLVEGQQLFDTVIVRFDGTQFWHDRNEPQRSKTANLLREALAGLREPEAIEALDVSKVELEAYKQHWKARQEAIKESLRDKAEDRLKDALRHAGADLKGYREVDGRYAVEYSVDGNHHTSILSKDGLQVQAAGICLIGTDGRFDLQSLVGVLREGRRRGRIVSVPLDNPRRYHEEDDD